MKKRPVIIPVGPSIAYVQLTQGMFSLIDSHDAEFVGKYNWSAHWAPGSSTFYASGKVDGTYRDLHNALLRPPAGMVTDHKNGASLDNRRSNLRHATRSQNRRNCRVYQTNSIGVTGVVGVDRKYLAYIHLRGKRHTLGRFDLLHDAKAARLAAEAEHYGEFRREL